MVSKRCLVYRFENNYFWPVINKITVGTCFFSWPLVPRFQKSRYKKLVAVASEAAKMCIGTVRKLRLRTLEQRFMEDFTLEKRLKLLSFSKIFRKI